MLRSQPARSTLRSVWRRQPLCPSPAQQFSSSPAAAAITPYRRTADAIVKQNVASPTRRGQSTATAAAYAMFSRPWHGTTH